MPDEIKIPAESESESEGVHYTGKLLARNTVYNLLGHISPLLVAFIAIPYLIEGMGIERFGVLAIAWTVVGYFSLFDMGIGRATTKFASEYYARGYQHQLGGLVRASLILLSAFGVIAGTILAAITPWLVSGLLNIPDYLLSETVGSFYLLAVSIPVALLIAGTRGVLESRQRFGTINAIRIPSSLATFLVPLLALSFSQSLFPIIGMLVISRVITLIFYLYSCFRGLGAASENTRMEKGYFKQLLRFGGWLTVTNIIAPLLGNTDRFFIGGLLTLSAVAYYATPFDVVNKLFIIPVGIMGVIFPAFSAFSAGEKERLDSLHRRTVNYILISVIPLVACIIVFAEPLLNIWLGAEFAAESAVVLQLLAAGVLFSSVARAPFNAIQALGRADLTAKLFLLELPIYIGLLILLTKTFGIIGTAGLWLARLVIELAILAAIYRKTTAVERPKSNFIHLYIWITGSIISSFFLSFIANTYLKMFSFIAFIIVIGMLIYMLLFDDYDRAILRDGMARFSPAKRKNS
jgi:O-antigen/teichoic acid export membrane protein